jgi:hypothetical protein
MNKHLRILMSAGVAALLFLFSSPARAGWQPYDWLVTIDVKAFPDQLRYTGSTLNPLVKAYISYAKFDGSNQNKYETIWFCRGKAYGLERVAPLSIDRGAGVGIRVNFKSRTPGPSDFKAAAQSILRTYLDVRLNKDSVQTAIVPDDYFSDVITAMGDEHFQIAQFQLEVPVQLASSLFVQDVSDKHTQHMCYAPGSYQF